MILRKALITEKDIIYLIYKSVLNNEYCVWDEKYPSMEDIENDLKTDNLFVLTDNIDIVGTISIVPENELNICKCWKVDEEKYKEIARVAIHPNYQGQGLSYKMVLLMEDVFKERGIEYIRLAAAKQNIPAYKTYLKASYITVGEDYIFGHEYYLMEKKIVND